MIPEPGHIVWNWDGKAVRVGFDRLGEGPTVLLLPALSSISTRREMRPLQERLASDFATVSIDWPGFGDEPRAPIRFVLLAASNAPNSAGMADCAHDGTWARLRRPNWLRGERLAQKMAVINAAGARHASIRFVTGMLDPMPSGASFIGTARRIKDPILVVYGEATPRRSKAEMDALASVPHVRSVELPHGKLGVHEEFPDVVAEAVRSFLGKTTRGVRSTSSGSSRQTF